MYKNITILVLVVICASFYVYQQVWAETNAPGSMNDPLITKSYLDENLERLIKEQVIQQTVKVVVLQKGQTIYASPGTEIVVRTGKTVAVSSDSNGISDVTAGVDIAPGGNIQTNHLLWFPREGRGIKASTTNQGDIYVVVKGNYTIINADGTLVP